jgi:hypothetical protein
MPLQRWILIVEPNDALRDIICSELAHCKSSNIQIVCVPFARDMLIEINQRDQLPDLVIVEWFASGNQVRACLQGLRNLAVLHRIRIIATAFDSPRRALGEAQELGVRRFVCKHPDEISFKKKIAEAIHEFLPKDSRVEAA